MITANKEKYLLEIFNNLNSEGHTRVSDLAKSLQISVSSASKMAKKLYEDGFVDFKRYGNISLTEKGKEICLKLLRKHNLLVNLLLVIGVEKDCIEKEVKKIESYVSDEIINKIEQFLMTQQKNNLC